MMTTEQQASMIALLHYLLATIKTMQCAITYKAYYRAFFLEPRRTEIIVLTEEDLRLIKETLKYVDGIDGPSIEELIEQMKNAI